MADASCDESPLAKFGGLPGSCFGEVEIIARGVSITPSVCAFGHSEACFTRRFRDLKVVPQSGQRASLRCLRRLLCCFAGGSII